MKTNSAPGGKTRGAHFTKRGYTYGKNELYKQKKEGEGSYLPYIYIITYLQEKVKRCKRNQR